MDQAPSTAGTKRRRIAARRLKKQTRRFNWPQILRCAALAVALYHVPFTLPRSVGAVLTTDGSLGVSFFFILSGFVLAHAYADTPFSNFDFYRKRFARIYPLHALTFILWTYLYFRSWGNSLPDKLNSGVANILLLHAFFSGTLFNLGFNAVSWSISVEAFFYLLFPFLVYRHTRHFVFLCYLGAFLFIPPGVAQNLNSAFPDFFYFNPLARFLEFSFGTVLQRAFVRWKPIANWVSVMQFFSIAVLLWPIVATHAIDTRHRNLLLLLPFGLVILSCAHTGFLGRLLGARAMVILGDSSFALYMIHHMLFRWLDPHLVDLHDPILAGVTAFGLAISMSIALHYFFEHPARALLSRRST